MNLRRAILPAAFCALLARLLCAALTHGTNDVDTFYNFGRFIYEHGLLAQYRASVEFNHPPLTGWFVALLYSLGHGFGFHFLLRLPGIVAEFAVVRLLLARHDRRGDPPAWALLLLALSPVGFMVNGYHGNVDGVLTWLLVRAALDLEQERVTRSGLWLGLACQLKIIPLLLAPAFFIAACARGRGGRFAGLVAAVILAGWAWPLIGLPGVFLQNVLGYSSNWGAWGVTWWLTLSGGADFAPVGFSGLTARQRMVMLGLKVTIVASALLLAWSRRKASGRDWQQTLSLSWLVFFVFAPGVGTQYLVWLAPFLAMAAPGWFTLVTAASSVFCFIFYQTISGGLPWNHGVSTGGLVAQWAPWSNLPWLACVAALIHGLTRGAAGRAQDGDSPAAGPQVSS